MSEPLLKTKLHVPRRRRQLVSRARLIRILDRTTECRLTLVSAPPGFGKTTLLSDWIATFQSDACSVAWVSLDERDNQPISFWTYVLAAIQTVAPEAATKGSVQLASSQPPPIEDVLSALINGFGAEIKDIVLVLDDYDVISQPEIHEGMAFLLDHLPPLVHLVIASRTDPPLPLSRLRARGELVELRAADLRFQPEESAAFFNEAMDMHLADADLDVLSSRTEGWAAALQLAALSMQGRDDVSDFIETFAGDNRYIVDYLVQEVLHRQPENVRDFLLKTSILERLSGPLCDALTGGRDGETTLRSLEQGNVFVVPLDDRRVWFRYHHLFADVLRAHLATEGAEHVHDLHRRASAWFEQNGERADAIRHALAGADFESAAGLVELALPNMLKSRDDTTLRTWFEALPGELLRDRPVLSAAYAGVLLQRSDLASVDALLQSAERSRESASHIASASAGTPVYVDEVQFRELPGMIALYRAGHAQVAGNLEDTAKYARLALERMPEDAPLRGGALALLGLALWSSGDLNAAYGTYAEGVARVHLDGYINDSSTIMLADMLVAQGHLRDALAAYQRSIHLATGQGKAAPRGTADLHVGISEIYREQGDVDAAIEHLSTSKALGDHAGLPENRFRWFTAMAAIKEIQGDLDAALDLLDNAERLYAPGFAPDVRPIPALRSRVWLHQGRLDEAQGWARERGLTANDELSYLREFEHITLARLFLALANAEAPRQILEKAIGLLDRLEAAAEAGGRNGSLIEVLVLRALAHQARGETASALSLLERALALAEPQGYVRAFLDEGPPMQELLGRCDKSANSGYAGRLLALFREPDRKPFAASAGEYNLSERELDVMRLLATGLSGPDIARELVVSLNTVRTHTKSIYTKLGVQNRRAAVLRAQELQIL